MMVLRISVYMSVHALICTFDCLRSSFICATCCHPYPIHGTVCVLHLLLNIPTNVLRTVSQKYSLHLHGAVHTSRKLVKKGMNYFAGYIARLLENQPKTNEACSACNN
jgi:hypothetical protein